jgi:hypothetical protein
LNGQNSSTFYWRMPDWLNRYMVLFTLPSFNCCRSKLLVSLVKKRVIEFLVLSLNFWRHQTLLNLIDQRFLTGFPWKGKSAPRALHIIKLMIHFSGQIFGMKWLLLH